MRDAILRNHLNGWSQGILGDPGAVSGGVGARKSLTGRDKKKIGRKESQERKEESKVQIVFP